VLLGRDALDRWEVKVAQLAEDIAPWAEKSVATAHDDAAAKSA
jgi:hypothetical protein